MPRRARFSGRRPITRRATRRRSAPPSAGDATRCSSRASGLVGLDPATGAVLFQRAVAIAIRRVGQRRDAARRRRSDFRLGDLRNRCGRVRVKGRRAHRALVVGRCAVESLRDERPCRRLPVRISRTPGVRSELSRGGSEHRRGAMERRPLSRRVDHAGGRSTADRAGDRRARPGAPHHRRPSVRSRRRRFCRRPFARFLRCRTVSFTSATTTRWCAWTCAASRPERGSEVDAGIHPQTG